MPSLLTKLAGGSRKQFTQPPWWSTERAVWRDLVGDKEKIGADFAGYVSDAYKANGVVFACILARLLVFSEARFVWRQLVNGRPSRLFGSADLRLLERPWPGGTTGEMLARMEQDASLAGNAFLTVVGSGDERRLRRLRPDWVTIIAGSDSDDPYALDAQVVGYVYEPGGRLDRAEVLLPGEVAHYSPIPDPDAQFRGMSWLTPVLREIESDKATTKHKLNFFRNGAVPQVVVSYDKSVTRTDFERYVQLFKDRHEGVDNHYRTLHLGGGADVNVVGSSIQQLDLKVSQGTLETRVAAAAGVHPVIVGLSEGLQGSSLNTGNFDAARRRFIDGTIRPLWRMAAASLATLVAAQGDGVQLWYDDRDVPFLREEAKSAAEILRAEAETIARLLDAGFDADTAVDAVVSGDLRRLAGAHSGLFSVQLQPAGAAEGRDAVLGDLSDRVTAVGVLIRSGFRPEATLEALGLPPIEHVGLLPVTVQSEEIPGQSGSETRSVDAGDIVTKMRHVDELARRDRELERIRGELERVKAGRRIVVHRADDGLVDSIEEVATNGSP